MRKTECKIPVDGGTSEKNPWLPRWGQWILILTMFVYVATLQLIIPAIGYSLYLLLGAIILLGFWIGGIDRCATKRQFLKAIAPILVPLAFILIFAAVTSKVSLTLLNIDSQDANNAVGSMNGLYGNLWGLTLDNLNTNPTALSWFSYALPAFTVGVVLFIIGDGKNNTSIQTGADVIIFLPLIVDLAMSMAGYSHVGLISQVPGISDAINFLPSVVQMLLQIGMSLSVDLIFASFLIPSIEKAITGGGPTEVSQE